MSPEWAGVIINIITVLVAVVAAAFGIRTFRHQQTSSDVQLALSIFEQINRYWDRVVDTDAAHYDYDVGQILAQFEIAATLFNRKALTRKALPILKDHIVEVFQSLISSSHGEQLYERCCSSPDTFQELKSFFLAHAPDLLRQIEAMNKAPPAKIVQLEPQSLTVAPAAAPV